MNSNQCGKQGCSQGSLWPSASPRVTEKTLKIRNRAASPRKPRILLFPGVFSEYAILSKDPLVHDGTTVFLDGKHQKLQVIDTILVGKNQFFRLSLNKETSLLSTHRSQGCILGFGQPKLGHLPWGGVACWDRDTSCFIYPANCVPYFSNQPSPHAKDLLLWIEPF